MPALTNDRLVQSFQTNVIVVPVRANTTIYAGALVALITSGAGAGNAVPASDSANRVILGVAEHRAVNNTSTDGAVNVRVRFGAAFKFNRQGTINNTHLGRVAYCVDDNTVQVGLTTNRVKVGKIVQVDPDGVWVWIPYPGVPNGVVNATVDGTWDNTNEGPLLAELRDVHNNYDI